MHLQAFRATVELVADTTNCFCLAEPPTSKENPMSNTIPAGTWTLDATHSTVAFQIRHLAISKVKGTFEEAAATLITGATPAESSASGSVKVASINTNQEQRDEHLRTGDFFAADEFPEITFHSTKVEGDEEELKVQGELTMRGVTKPVVFDVEVGGVVVDPYGNTKLGLEAKTKINRTDFGVNFNAALETGGVMLGEEVKLELDLQFALNA